MSDVVIAGIGQMPVGEHYTSSLRGLALDAIDMALKDSGGLRPDTLYVANMLAPVVSHQAHLGALISDYAGLTGIEAAVVEAGGASGGAALRMGYMAVAAGAAEVALVVGVEKITDKLGTGAEAAQMLNVDSDYEAVQGLTPNAQAALLMARYLHEYHPPRQAFGGFPRVAHANAVSNPFAMFRSPLSADAYEQASQGGQPLNMFDIAPVADGAAALVITRRELLPAETGHPLVRISGSSHVTGRLALHDRLDVLDLEPARISVERACRKADIRPGDVDLFELYDSSSIMAVLSLEAAGFAPRGQGWRLAQDEQLGLNGLLPIATFGGLKARGNPGGATGVYQAVEAALQLRGEAGANQVLHARRALIQCLGGSAANAVTHVLERLA
ncbi:MAG: thiolase domain-containing protein [Chloroflexi bacterium]|nr:thiolase domain-containing protein [Chloroflexota bacterium]